MNFPDGLFPAMWQALAWLPFTACLAWAVWKAPWKRLANGTQSNVWLGAMVSLAVLWSMKAGVHPGLDLHLLGAMVAVLMFGPQLALLALTLVAAAVTLNGAAGWQAFALNALAMAVLPVGVAHAVHRAVERWLPRHFFIYVFVTAFLGAVLTVALTGATVTLLLQVAGTYPADLLFGQYLPYFLLLGFPEGWLSGALVTIMVVYLPRWVCTFDDSRYLLNK